nr:Chain C, RIBONUCLEOPROTEIN PTB-BINDING 1 [Mus musculus]3ZZY_D Chain D, RIBONUCLEOPROTEIN PTB-BINDING 1 [Mus musculus]
GAMGPGVSLLGAPPKD